MNDMELADEIERVPHRCFTPDELRQIIAALRHGPDEITPLPSTSDEERVRDLAQRMIGRWNGPNEMLLAFLRLLLHERPPSGEDKNGK